jgi:hypothetical protein
MIDCRKAGFLSEITSVAIGGDSCKYAMRTRTSSWNGNLFKQVEYQIRLGISDIKFANFPCLLT